MITPVDIQEKQFARSIKGFKEDEVNEFLDQITLDLERIIEDNRQLRLENEQLKNEVSKFREAEHSVIDTLETAKALMGDISASAEKRAQVILRNAELEAETMVREASESVARMNDENAQIKSRLASFKKRYKELLESELRNLDHGIGEMFSELSMDDLSDIPEANEKAPSVSRSAVNYTKRPAGASGGKGTSGYSRQDLEKTMVHVK